MAETVLDVRGLRCPQPIMRIAASVISMKKGDVLLVTADCPTFEDDVKKWCERSNKTAVLSQRNGNEITFAIHV